MAEPPTRVGRPPTRPDLPAFVDDASASPPAARPRESSPAAERWAPGCSDGGLDGVDLEQLAETLPNVDLPAAFARFSEETGLASSDDFLEFLLSQRLVRRSEFLRAHALGRIELADSFAGDGREAEYGYEEMANIGEGGMAWIRLARDLRLRRKVAVKMLKPEVGTGENRCRFLREAQVTAQLDHPGIVPVHNVLGDEGDGTDEALCFVMKLVHGRTLRELVVGARRFLDERPGEPLPPDLQPRRLLEHFVKVCEALSYAHSKGVIHRDLKPTNIMVGEFGEVYVMDWGIARVFGDSTEPGVGAGQPLDGVVDGGLDGHTQVGEVIGTPNYMAPEQARGDIGDLGPACDQYALGLVLQEILTLRRAVDGDSMNTIIAMAGRAERKPMTHHTPGHSVHRELRAIVRRATRLDPSDRYPSVEAFAEDIRRHLRGDETEALPDDALRSVWRWTSKHRRTTLTAVLLLVTSLALGMMWSLHRGKVAAEQAKVRESLVTRFQAGVAAKAHRIDASLLHLEGLLHGLAEQAIYLLERAGPNQERLYRQADFLDPGRAPADLIRSPLYAPEVSVDYPVAKPAPGVRWGAVRPLVQKLAPLRHAYRRMVLDSRGEREPAALPDPGEALQILLERGAPVRWVYIGLEVGVMFSYPGKGSYRAEYDPRKRPWYELGRGRHTVAWGNPYVDPHGQGYVLPAARSLVGSGGTFHGVVGFDVTFDDLIRSYLAYDGAGVLDSYLLDGEGRVVVRSSLLGRSAPSDGDDPRLALKPFAVAAARELAVAGRAGVVETAEGGEPRLYVIARVPTLGWSYVVEARIEDVLAAAK